MDEKTRQDEYEEPSLVDLEDVAGGLADPIVCDTGGSVTVPKSSFDESA